MRHLLPKICRRFPLILGFVVIAFPSLSFAEGVFMMPYNCPELLPDNTPYIEFFTAAAKGAATNDPKLSARLFRILKMGERVNNDFDRSRKENPIDVAIRKTICFYREQKDPMSPIPFDDRGFLTFLNSSIRELETRVDDIVYQVEFEKFQRREYELRALRNRSKIATIEKKADRAADNSFEKLSQAARRKVKIHP